MKPGGHARLVLLLAAGALLSAAPPALSYRPFDGTDAAVARTGEVEVELGPVGILEAGSDHLLVVPAGILNLGIYRNAELVLEGKQYYRLQEPMAEARAGRLALADTALSMKNVWGRGFLQGGEGTSVATEIGVLLPTYHDQAGVGATGTVIVSHLAGPLSLHLNLEGFLSRAHNAGAFVGLIVEGPSARGVRPVAEAFVAGEHDAGHTYSALLGAIWDLREGLSFDAAARVARLSDGTLSMNAIELRLGLTWVFALWSG